MNDLILTSIGRMVCRTAADLSLGEFYEAAACVRSNRSVDETLTIYFSTEQHEVHTNEMRKPKSDQIEAIAIEIVYHQKTWPDNHKCKATNKNARRDQIKSKRQKWDFIANSFHESKRHFNINKNKHLFDNMRSSAYVNKYQIKSNHRKRFVLEK